jgi:hypothetical protein
VELRLDLEKLGRNLTHKGRIMLGLRTRGFDWKEIAEVLHITQTAARAVFWREVKRAGFRNAGSSRQEKPAGRRESDTNCMSDDLTVPRIRHSFVEGRRNRRRQAALRPGEPE